jgi:hypothetical protein
MADTEAGEPRVQVRCMCSKYTVPFSLLCMYSVHRSIMKAYWLCRKHIPSAYEHCLKIINQFAKYPTILAYDMCRMCCKLYRYVRYTAAHIADKIGCGTHTYGLHCMCRCGTKDEAECVDCKEPRYVAGKEPQNKNGKKTKGVPRKRFLYVPVRNWIKWVDLASQ